MIEITAQVSLQGYDDSKAAYRRHPAAGAHRKKGMGRMEERPEENLDREESIEEEAPEVEGHRKRFDVEEEGVGRKKRGPEAEDDLEKGRRR